jgi:hypothetical protein
MARTFSAGSSLTHSHQQLNMRCSVTAVSAEDEENYKQICIMLNLAEVKMQTVKNLKTQLLLRNLSLTGNKPALARRLFFYCESQAQHDALPPPPLATNLIADTELDPEDEDSDDEEEWETRVGISYHTSYLCMLGQEQDSPLFWVAESSVRGMQRKRLQKHKECMVRSAIVPLFRNELDEQSK